MFMKQECVENDKLVIFIAFCSTSEHCVAHMLMFKDSQFHNELKNGFSPGSLMYTFDLLLESQSATKTASCRTMGDFLDSYSLHKTLPVLGTCDQNS
jgi:hypothetical protein